MFLTATQPSSCGNLEEKIFVFGEMVQLTVDGNAAKTNPTMCLVDANGLLVQGTLDNADLDGAFYSEGYFDGCTRMIEVGFFQRIEFLPV